MGATGQKFWQLSLSGWERFRCGIAGVLIFALGGSLFAQPASPQTSPALQFNPDLLVGEHPCRGKNPDGSEYEGTVRIRVKNDVVLIEWNIKDDIFYGLGLVEGMTLGVALENGLVIYQIVGQGEGQSLVGMWAKQDAESATEESIFIGKADVEAATFTAQPIDGNYRSTGDTFGKGKKAEQISIAGGDAVKRVFLNRKTPTFVAQGLLLSNGFAAITPTGLVVYQVGRDPQGRVALTGHSIDKEGNLREAALVPVE